MRYQAHDPDRPCQTPGLFYFDKYDYSLPKRKQKMNDENKTRSQTPERRCPECRALLKPRRGSRPDPCDLVCGGCGKQFNGCEMEKEPG